MKELTAIKDKYLYLFADCFPVKGHTRTMLCDVSRQKVYFVDNSYYELLSVLKDNNIGTVAEMLDGEEDLIFFKEFIDYLLDIELAIVVDTLDRFPAMELEWDHPSKIINSIIDIRDEMHDFEKIFNELEVLACYHIQIRAYCKLPVSKLEEILALTVGKNFRSVDFLIEYDGKEAEVKALLDKYEIAQVTYHTYEMELFDEEPEAKNRSKVYHGSLGYTKQKVSGCDGCGLVDINSMRIRDVKGFTENIKHNGCLNRKISIDETGNVKNCPSMKKSYGHVNNISLTKIADDTEFQKPWNITKDNIDGCRDCEYRYICTDCRAYTTDGELHSKPAKCQYDPYTGKWADKVESVNTVFA
ncbi:MAG: grasp-with-spasm system SPASM domain peptide maturase [Kordia sp.]|uniref:grasp-with-spasm system SPASM domain peptide maturase n=1 Tax=Kordia sp. TaxID=1965332 RepID=UPI00385E346C